jgi:ketosteroid isomerase-like protein
LVDALVSEASGVTPVGVRLSSRARSKREKPVRQRTGFFCATKELKFTPMQQMCEARATDALSGTLLSHGRAFRNDPVGHFSEERDCRVSSKREKPLRQRTGFFCATKELKFTPMHQMCEV